MPVPAHVAIIMDGNGRWARSRRKPRHAGHKAGETATRSIVEACAERGVAQLTLFAFSSENWDRPQSEVGRLMELFLEALDSRVKAMHENGIRLCFIGDRRRFSEKLQQRMNQAEALTVDNHRMQVNVAVSYGGRWEIVEAARAVAAAVADGELSVDAIDEAALAGYMQLPASLPPPDLFIRTGGEQRLSNFLLWHLAYTELWFTDILWPDFGPEALDEAFTWFAGRERRYGKVAHA